MTRDYHVLDRATALSWIARHRVWKYFNVAHPYEISVDLFSFFRIFDSANTEKETQRAVLVAVPFRH